MPRQVGLGLLGLLRLGFQFLFSQSRLEIFGQRHEPLRNTVSNERLTGSDFTLFLVNCEIIGRFLRTPNNENPR